MLDGYLKLLEITKRISSTFTTMLTIYMNIIFKKVKVSVNKNKFNKSLVIINSDFFINSSEDSTIT